MNDPWDDAVRSQAGLVVTASGLRVPVAVPTSPAAWAATGDPTMPAAAGPEAKYRGVGPKGYRRSDQHVREQICDRLMLDPYLDASGVAVTVSKGRVALTGSVPTERMRESAIAAAGAVASGPVDSKLQVAGARAARTSRARQKPKRRADRTRKRGGGR